MTRHRKVNIGIGKLKKNSIVKGFLIVLIALFLLAVLAVMIDETVSRHESRWTDGGGRHVEMVSGKLSEED